MANQMSSAPAPSALSSDAIQAQITTFGASLRAQGFSTATIQIKLQLLRKLDQWLRRRQIETPSIDETQIAKFLRFRDSQSHLRRSDPSTRRLFLRQLREVGVVRSPSSGCDRNPLEQLQSNLARYLVEERGLGRATVEQYLIETRRFLFERFGTGPITLRELHPQEVSRFIVRRAGSAGPSATRHAATALRTLFRFLQKRGDIDADLAASVPAVANWSLAGLPKYLSCHEVERVLQTCQGDSAEERRDRAILLLLARLGLRAGEVAQLTLDDIDWDSGELGIRGKGGRLDRLPGSEKGTRHFSERFFRVF